MLETLFEALDENVFTTELKESLEAQFNEAVESKAQSLAEELAAEKISEAVEGMTERVKEIEAENQVKLEEAKEALVVEFAEKESAIIESVDRYLDKAIEEFVAEAKEALDASVKSEKADLVIEALSAMMVSAGVEVSQIIEAKETSDVEKQLEESIAKYDALMESFISKENEVDALIKIGVINEMKEGLTLVESEKFEKLANIVEFSKDAAYLEKLETIKESVKGSVEEKSEEKIEESIARPASIDKRFI